MENTMGSRLKELRMALGLSQAKLATCLGVDRSSVTNYELGRSTPLNSILESICREYGVSKEWLMDGTGTMFVNSTRDLELQAFCDEIMDNAPEDFRRRFVKALARLSPSEWETLEKMAREIAEASGAPVQHAGEPASPVEAIPFQAVQALFRVRMFEEAVGAGRGQFVSDATERTIDLVKPPPEGTNFMLRVCGDSMVPRFRPGDLIFVQQVPRITFGQIGVFSVEGEMVIKKYTRSGLESLNPAYPLIPPSDGIRCQGLVLGTADNSYFPQT